MTRFLNISTDNTLGGSSPSDEFVASQKAIKYYVDNNSSNVQVDNLTITTNASDEIQTVAAINQNSGILKFWKGTKAQYDALPSHDSDTQYTVTGDNTAGMMPTGSIIPFAGTTVPDGWLLCDGSAISRTTYADLFAVIGTVYGTGDGSTTFNLPNANWSCIEGRTSSQYVGNTQKGSLPKITGNTGGCVGNASPGGVFTQGSQAGTAGGGSGKFYVNNFDASRSSSSYWRTDDEVHPMAIGMYYVIKY